MTRPVAVLGAGPGGLAAAWALMAEGVPAVVFEAAGHVGGLARTLDLWGRRVDLGAHLWAAGRPEVDALGTSVLGDAWHDVIDRRGLLGDGRHHAYPPSPLSLALTMGPMESVRSLASWVARPRSATPRSCAELTDAVLGRRLSRTLFGSYVEKLWGAPAGEIDVEFARQLVTPVRLRDVGRRLVAGRVPPPTFPYPDGGMGALWDGMAASVTAHGGDIRLHERVERLVVQNGRVVAVETTGGTTEIGGVVSTLPLPFLAASLPDVPGDLLAAARGARPRSTVLVYLRLTGGEPLPYLWLYLVDRDVTAGRVANPTLWWPGADPQAGAEVLTVETWCDPGDAIWTASDDETVARAEADLRRVGVLGSARVTDRHIERVGGTHPSHRRGSPEASAHLRELVDRVDGLASVGRHGRGTIADMAGTVAGGLAAGRAMVRTGALA